MLPQGEAASIDQPPTSRRRTNLPADLTPFVGRRGDRAEVRRLLSASRMVTLTGVGGVGKSRLALQVAREVRRVFEDGVWIIDLGQATGSKSVAEAVAVALDLRREGSRARSAELVANLRDRHLLLVFDNCDRVADQVSRFASALLHLAPRAAVLATGRQPLEISGEHTLPVSPLSTPDPIDMPSDATLVRHDAPVLFAQRAAAVVPGFTITPENQSDVAELCWHLDGLPLALELAAVRLRSLSVAQVRAACADPFALLTEGTRDAPARHRSMRACMDLSYDSCSARERLLWAQLSAAPESFDLDMAMCVGARNGLDHTALRDLVSGLVNKSVLYREEAPAERVPAFPAGSSVRYRMLRTVRLYGREKLTDHGEGRWSQTPTRLVEPSRHGPDDRGAAIAPLFGVTADVLRGQDIVAMLQHTVALCVAGEFDRAEALCTECRALSIARQDAWGLSYTLWIFGLIRWQRRDYAQAIRDALASTQTGPHAHERLAVARAHELLAWIAATIGAHERAAELLGASNTAWRLVPANTRRSDWEDERRRHCEAQIRESLDEGKFLAALRRGADMKHPDAFLDGWKQLPLPVGIGGIATQARGTSPLTQRQYEVALLVAAGLSDRDIADRLVVAQRTAEGHVANILSRLGFSSRAQIAAWVAAGRHGDASSSTEIAGRAGASPVTLATFVRRSATSGIRRIAS